MNIPIDKIKEIIEKSNPEDWDMPCNSPAYYCGCIMRLSHKNINLSLSHYNRYSSIDMGTGQYGEEDFVVSIGSFCQRIDIDKDFLKLHFYRIYNELSNKVYEKIRIEKEQSIIKTIDAIDNCLNNKKQIRESHTCKVGPVLATVFYIGGLFGAAMIFYMMFSLYYTILNN